ncbi:uncharacterized protein LOC111829656 isoform X2 [Capsella rubella]|uniref:uncharacterized protein LOC111829656 isoform X2 n=1 Tax=Capsella rubella TaxID=81985 RepID=UPI000CD55EF8|nr:uncharacterized protein LOC111829656 isoform X2 [Capsella rubella]
MPSSSSPLKHVFWSGDLPETLFDDVLLASPLGALFSLPVRQCAMSGQLVHQMLCRQLHTDNSDETWFLFAGQPIRFSLMEFEQITGLCCAPFPAASDLEPVTTHSEGSAPYWYTLIGRKLGGATVEDLLSLLKSDANMPAWRKFRLALIVIVEGILLCRKFRLALISCSDRRTDLKERPSRPCPLKARIEISHV